jgi:DNA primase
MIPRDFIDQLIARVDIVDVIDRRVPLKKAGQNYQACCPFHQERSPSFTVSPMKQFYHCFGCGAHGTAISFLMEYGGLSFVDAVRELASDVGLPVPEEAAQGGRPKAAPQLGEAMETAAAFYRQQLKASPRAIDYLKRRGLTGAVAARFGLGYAPGLTSALKAAFPDYQGPELVTAGLVIDGERGRYDRFRDRIMFPIRNSKGSVIGFGGRILDQGEPKYLNTPETPLFSKGNEIYGLFEARQSIREAGKVVVVEGYMDVVALNQFGIGYAVATLGTATTPVHVRTMLRHADRICFSFDGDKAGRKAAWRALENTLEPMQDGKEVSFLFLPEGEDPDSFVRTQGPQRFEQLLDKHAVPLSELMVRELIHEEAIDSQEGRARVLKSAQPMLAKLAGAPLLAALIRRDLAQRLKLTAEEVGILLGQGQKAGAKTAWRPRELGVATRSPSRQPSLYRHAATLLVLQSSWASQIDLDTLLPDEPFAQELASLIVWMKTLKVNSAAQLEEAARGGPFEKLVATLHAETMQLGQDTIEETVMTDLLRQIHSKWLIREQSRLSQIPLGQLSLAERQKFKEISELLAQNRA